MESKSLLLKGYKVRIGGGGGEEMNVWNSQWLSNKNNGRVTTDRREFLNLLVSDLMNCETKAWDHHKISQIFNERDKQLIGLIPLS